ncbi:GNAT family N-acetyltransferase [Iodobacter fluviatilis]|uniref:Acetyltransferase (GNAT) family n=1 Tax=Iodobacter fluviatilis TaxID=537 RepID=A0A377SXP6_9NEIS|nr:GNAT family N-acetyltransferase [Iodobacter fluviatilis]TCU85037.1 acetyltransferase (GNAT) family protein [Iodobacter fluviatilis]STR45279.1 Acetyltransferase (GNAT) family [Iodobacter fluviatilis]
MEFKKIDPQHDFDLCLQFRKDAYFCSFQTWAGFTEFVGLDGADYHHKILSRIDDPRWGYFHVHSEGQIIGQIEFKTYSHLEQTGYVHLFYLAPEYRGKGYFKQLNQFVMAQLENANCAVAVLALGRENHAAMGAYQKNGWLMQGAKNERSDYWAYHLNSQCGDV